MERSHSRFAKRRCLRWAAGLGLAATLALPALPVAAQPEVQTGPIAATPANCTIQFSVANPSPGNQEVPFSLIMSGTALDETATSGTGISRVQAFLGNRDLGGTFIGQADLTQQQTGPRGAWSLTATFPPNVVGGQQVFVYSMSSVSGQEAVVSIPIAFGTVPTDQLSTVSQSSCPVVMSPTPLPIASTLVH